MNDIQCGWLSPSGDFYPSNFGEHTEWAFNYLDENDLEDEFYKYKKENYETCRDAIDYLINVKHWVLIHNPSMQNIEIERSDFKVTASQKKFLFNYLLNHNVDMAITFLKTI